ncbi:DUF3040 domain-containing protein [Streptomyces agglomeratus]|uniref:DUF3040 domain-containing protein n=1 Tax=Streptomyces agglomeratus TaxID=285458 RepID=UPI0034E419B9
MRETLEAKPPFRLGWSLEGGAVSHFDERLLKDLEQQMEQSDPRFAQALESGRPRRPRKYRHRPAWLVCPPLFFRLSRPA